MKPSTNYTPNAKTGLISKGDPKLKRVVIFDTGEEESSPLKFTTAGMSGIGVTIPSGTYEVIGYANIKGDLAEDATNEVQEIKSPLFTFTIK